MTQNERLDEDFADLPPDVRAEIEGMQGVGLHHAPAGAQVEDPADQAETEARDGLFRHPETDRAGTEWEPNWEPLETYPGGPAMLDDGARQVLAVRQDGLWYEVTNDALRPLAGYEPMLWSRAPDRVQDDMLSS